MSHLVYDISPDLVFCLQRGIKICYHDKEICIKLGKCRLTAM